MVSFVRSFSFFLDNYDFYTYEVLIDKMKFRL